MSEDKKKKNELTNIDETEQSELINIDENGEVVINDPELAKMTEELTQEELDEVAGGVQQAAVDDNAGCNNYGC